MTRATFFLFLLVSLCVGACSFLIDFDELQAGFKIAPPSDAGIREDAGSDARNGDGGKDGGVTE